MPGPVKVKVVPLIDVEFIATLKVTVTTELGQIPTAPLRGAIGATTGGVRFGLAPGLQHPGLRMSSNNAIEHIL